MRFSDYFNTKTPNIPYSPIAKEPRVRKNRETGKWETLTGAGEVDSSWNTREAAQKRRDELKAEEVAKKTKKEGES